KILLTNTYPHKMENKQQIINSKPLTMIDLLNSLIESKIEPGTPTNITLVLGLAGSHKGDLIEFLSGDKQSNNGLDEPTTLSTAFPGLTVIKKTNTAFFDYPKFGGSKTVEEETSATFLLNKIVDYANSIKLIFAIPESKNKLGLDDEHINSLIDESVKIIDNFDKLKDSIALVVTRDSSNNAASDKDFIKGITAKLMDTSKKYSMSETSSALKKQNFINILLQEKNGIHTNIGVFKKTESKVLEVNNKSLGMVINENTKFVKHDKQIFQCASCLDKMMNDLRSVLSNSLSETKQLVLKYFESLETNSEDFKDLEDKYRLGAILFQELRYFTSNKYLLAQFLMQLEKKYNFIPKNIIRSIYHYCENMRLLLEISFLQSSKYPVFTEIDKEHLSVTTAIIENLEKSQAWYSALVILYANLSNYYMKNSDKIDSLYHKAKPETCDVSMIGKTYDDVKQDISHTMQDILRGMDGEEFQQMTLADNLNSASLSEACKAKLNVLSKMLYSLFFSSTDDARSSCSDGILKIEGQFVKLSDVPAEIMQHRKCDEDDSDVKEIRLFASNRVYIDEDLHVTGDGIQLSIIAPTWEVVGSRKIELIGKPGTSHTNEIALPANSKIPGDKGNDGKPGKPGGPAGNFLGIGFEFIHGKNLNISVIGGTGGPGQKGSNGISGEYKIPSNIEDSLKPERDINSCVKIEIPKKCQWINRDETRYHNDDVCTFTCDDDRYSCKDGGDGGKGGAGGEGGKPGERKLIELSTKSNIVGKSSDGLTGLNGEPGIPGKPSKKGMILHFKLRMLMPRYKINYTYRCDAHHTFDYNISHDVTCNDGRFIKEHFNSEDIESPEPAIARISADAINDYKFYLRTVLGDESHGNVRGKLLTDFINNIEQKNAVKELYHTVEFAKELKSLETQFYKLHKEFSFLPFYESLLNRITEYADQVHRQRQKKHYNNHENRILEDESEALRYLYTATFSKIFNIRENKSSNLIVDIEKYLDSALANIQKLDEYRQIDLMNQANKEYYNSLDEKISRAIDFSSKITNEINNYFDNLNANIKSLIGEAELSKTEVKNQMQNLVEMNKKVKNALMLRSLLGITKMVGAFLNLAGPVGAAAGAAVTGSLMVIESLSVRNVNKDNIKTASIPKVFNTNITNIETLFDKEKNVMLQAQLDAIVGAFDTTEQSVPGGQTPESVLKLKKFISDIKNDALKEKTLEPISPSKISERVDKVILSLDKEATALSDERYEGNKTIQAWSKFMHRAVNVMKIVQVPANVYPDIVEDNKKSDLVITAYKDAEDQLKKLDMYKNKIHDDIIPQFKALQKYLNSHLGKKNITRQNSLAGLDISKWKMQDILKDLRDYMRKITEGFEVQEDITRLIEKLDRALFTMIDIYRLIEDYRDKKELADYIQNVNPISGTAKKFKNKELQNVIDELKVIIQSNIVLEEYARVIHAVKQTVYPLAHHYLDKHQFLPFASSTSSNITSFVADAVDHLHQIRSTFKNNRASVDDYDSYIMPNADFTTEDEDLRGAFYTWRYTEHKHAISQLLRGKKITLKSDITKGIGLPAIKFRKIGVNFKFADATAEKEFKANLNGFVLTLVHLGNSQYQCNDKFHTIANDNQRLVIEFRTSKGNMVFTKLEENQALLSPYTSWTLSLSSPKNRGFDGLTRFENMTIDLALEGSADYLTSTDDVSKSVIDNICNSNLSQYYNEDKTVLGISPAKPEDRIVLDEISGLTAKPIDEDQKNHPRKRRSLGDHEFEQDVEDLFSTSGAGSSMKSSFVNNIFNLIGTGLVAYEYLNPVNRIRQWFAKDEMSIGPADSFVLDGGVPRSVKMLNVEFPAATDSVKVAKLFIDDESPTVNNLFNDSSFCSHGNLLLLDMLIRSKSGVKYSCKSNALDAKVDPVFAQHLAIMRIYPLDSTRLVILWIQHLRTKVDPNRETLYMCTILNLTTCQSKDLVIPSARSIMASVFFTSYDDSFDIAILCDNDRYCKYNIDVDGNITSRGISKSELRFYYYASRTEHTTLRAIESSTGKRLKLYLQNRYDGTLRSSWQMLAPFYKNSGVFKFDSLNSEDDKYVMNVMSDSIAHGRISIAAAMHTRAKVWQFDQEGNLKLKALIEHEFFVSYVRVLNTADGGLFLLSMDTGNSRLEKIYNKNYKKYYLTKVAADGNITGTMQNAADPDVNLSRDTQVQLFENNANEYCVNFQNTAHFYLRSNVRERSSEGVRLVMCFKDSDGAGSSMKSSFVNNIFNLIGTGLVAYEYLNPVNRIRQWFAKDEMNIGQADSFVLDGGVPRSVNMLNVEFPSAATDSPKVAKLFIDDELPTVNNLFNDSSFCSHGNLLLLDMLIRSKSGVKYSRESNSLDAKVDPVTNGKADNQTKTILLMCSILNFTTCQSKELVLSEYVANAPDFFMANGDSFDVVVLCSESTYWKYNIDVEGNVISKLHYDPRRNYEGTTLRVLVTDERRKLYVTNTLDGYLTSSLEKSDGKQLDSWVMLLLILDDAQYNVLNDEDDPEYVKNVVAYSTAHGMIGIATAVDETVKIWQFDDKGYLKLNASIENL
ncbi:hypothetical protein TSAR_012591, partial [Trichomalopsis sarcophagae]